MKTYTADEIKTILEAHKLWVESFGERGSRAYLRGADLSRADLRGAYLRGADLSRAYLSGADLSRADLRGADLSRADLSRADLSGADLSRAYLRGAYLSRADLRGAYLRGAEGYVHPLSCPSHGEFTAWKKAVVDNHYALVQLTIPADAKRLSSTGRKCRCDKAVVVAITDLTTNEPITECRSYYAGKFRYIVGNEVSVGNFDNDRWNECSTGIHFFIDRQEAIDYDM